MKKLYINFMLALFTVVGVFSLGSTVNAAEEDPSVSWAVTYDGSALSSDLTNEEATKAITSAMPGDTISISVDYVNGSSKTTDWYMSSQVLSSLESSSEAAGGGYTYSISYDNGTGNVTTIYDSKSLGGDNDTVKGLLQANAITDSDEGTSYLYVGQLASGKNGTVYISIKLDGTSQTNSYMDTLASLGISFGVEETATDSKTIVNNVVTTLPSGVKVVQVKGDSRIITIPDEDTPLAGGGTPQTGDSILPLVVSAAALLVGIMLLLWYFKKAKELREEEA